MTAEPRRLEKLDRKLPRREVKSLEKLTPAYLREPHIFLLLQRLARYGVGQPIPVTAVGQLIEKDETGMSTLGWIAALKAEVITLNDRTFTLDAKKLQSYGIKSMRPPRLTEAEERGLRNAYLRDQARLKDVVDAYNKARMKMAKINGTQYWADWELRGMDKIKRVTKVLRQLDQMQILADDYIAFFYAMFASIGWKRSVPLNHCTGTKSEQAWAEYRAEAAELLHNERMAVQAQEERFSPWVDMDEILENQKRRMVSNGQAENCMFQISRFNGYHPKSDACQGCPVKANCEELLLATCKANFPEIVDSVLKIRNGEEKVSHVLFLARQYGRAFNRWTAPWQQPTPPVQTANP